MHCHYLIVFRAHIYGAVELQQQNVKTSSIDDYEVPSMSSSGKISSTTRSNKTQSKHCIITRESFLCSYKLIFLNVYLLHYSQ